MKEKVVDWGDKIVTGHMDWVNVALALHTVIWKNSGYPSSTVSSTEQECEETMRPAILAVLPKLGLNRNFPCDILFGSKSNFKDTIQ